MKRQMMPAPMNEMAIGRKISDLAAFSAFARSASTATARPSAVASDVTTMTHQTLLKIVPRIEDRTAHERKNSPTTSGPSELGAAIERLRRAAAGDGTDEDAEREQCQRDEEQLAREDVRPVVEVDGVLAGEDAVL